MVQFWHQLGFVSQVDPPRLLAGGLPFFVEDERGEIHARSGVESPPPTPPSRNNHPLGGLNQPIKTPKRLRQHLQSAIAVELSTIPLYLFAQYTVKVPQKYANDPRYVDPVVSAVKGEEIDLSLYPHTLTLNYAQASLPRRCCILVLPVIFSKQLVESLNYTIRMLFRCILATCFTEFPSSRYG